MPASAGVASALDTGGGILDQVLGPEAKQQWIVIELTGRSRGGEVNRPAKRILGVEAAHSASVLPLSWNKLARRVLLPTSLSPDAILARPQPG